MSDKRVIIKFKNITEIDKEIFTKSSLTLLDVSGNLISVNKIHKNSQKFQKFIKIIKPSFIYNIHHNF